VRHPASTKHPFGVDVVYKCFWCKRLFWSFAESCALQTISSEDIPHITVKLADDGAEVPQSTVISCKECKGVEQAPVVNLRPEAVRRPDVAVERPITARDAAWERFTNTARRALGG
jgi:hypothetical protein